MAEPAHKAHTKPIPEIKLKGRLLRLVYLKKNN
jgi:hypothetical protein